MLLPSARQRRLFCLFLCCGFSTRYSVCALSLSLSLYPSWHAPSGSNLSLLLLGDPCFFWVACHPNRTFPSKEPEQEPQNRSFPSPHCQTMPSDPWPTTSYIGWVQAGDLAHTSPFSPATHAFTVFWRLVCTFYRALLASYDVGCFPNCHSLWLASFGGWALSDHGPSFPQPTLYSLRGLVSISYHTTLLFLL